MRRSPGFFVLCLTQATVETFLVGSGERPRMYSGKEQKACRRTEEEDDVLILGSLSSPPPSSKAAPQSKSLDPCSSEVGFISFFFFHYKSMASGPTSDLRKSEIKKKLQGLSRWRTRSAQQVRREIRAAGSPHTARIKTACWPGTHHALPTFYRGRTSR